MRTLIVNVNWVGDILFSTPAIRAIRHQFPDDHLACLLPARGKEVLETNSYLNELIFYDERAPLTSFKTLKLIHALKKHKFDRAIFFHRSRSKVLITKLAGISERLGFVGQTSNRFLTKAVAIPTQTLHKTDFFLALLNSLGIKSQGRTPDFFTTAKHQSQALDLLQSVGISKGEPYVVIHAGGNWDLKRWPASYFIQWIKLFKNEFNFKVILCGTESDLAQVAQVKDAFLGNDVISLCGKTSVGSLAVILKNAKLLLSNDSGPIHLAASQATPILGLYGPTSFFETGPISSGPIKILQKDVGCVVPCYFRTCNYRVCMDWLSPEEVFTQSVDLLKNLNPEASNERI